MNVLVTQSSVASCFCSAFFFFLPQRLLFCWEFCLEANPNVGISNGLGSHVFRKLLGREQFHGLGSMYCRGAAAVILTYDVNSLQSLAELEDRFLALTDSASADCIFAIVGNKVDLSDDCALPPDENRPEKAVAGCSSKVRKQVRVEDAIALYKKILKYKMLDEKDVPAAEKMCFETSAKTGYKVDYLFETVFDMVVPIIVRQKAEGPSQTVDITDYKPAKRTKSGCCA
uniref:RAB20, member RAS onco family n=1 Tax=Meleagris gallopavo TaxID=9103 RepID=G1NPT1_MELGA